MVYKLCYAVALLGYMLTVVIFLGGKNLAEAIPSSVIEASITSIFYGLYFGVLSRDVSELCTEYVAAKIGVSKIPLNLYILVSHQFDINKLVIYT